MTFTLVATRCTGVTGTNFVPVAPAVPLRVPWCFAAVTTVLSTASATSTASYVCAAAGGEGSDDGQEAGALFVARCKGLLQGLVGDDEHIDRVVFLNRRVCKVVQRRYHVTPQVGTRRRV